VPASGEPLGRLGDVLAVRDRVRTVGEDLLAQAILAGGVEVGELLGAEYQADARGAGAAEQAVDLPAARAANLSIISERVGDTYRR
jgi:hypothetical protein